MNLHPLSGIASSTGLSIPYIRKCLNRMPVIFGPFLHRGRNNAIQLEDGGLVIFQQISQLKEQGNDLPSIVQELSGSGLERAVKPVVKPEQTDTEPFETAKLAELYEKLDQERKRATEEKESRLQVLSDLNALKTGLKLLTDGKTDDVEKARVEMNHRRLKRAELLGKLETLSFWQTSKRRKLLKELKSIDLAETTDQTDQANVQTEQTGI